MLQSLLILSLVWIIPFGYGLALLLRPAKKPKLYHAFAAGVGWQALWVMPLLVVQTVFVSQIWPNYTVGFPERLLFLIVPWPVHVGGLTVTSIFEATAKQVTGHRQFTLMDNLHYFLALTAVQTTIVAALFAVRFRKVRQLRDPLLLALGALVFINGAMNLRFPWWGS